MAQTRYVNTASTPGGDGTTNATAGATRAYASLNEAVVALPAALTEPYTIICEGTTADTTPVTITADTTNTNTLTIKTAAGATRHPGKWSTAHYRLDVTNATDDFAWALYDNNGTEYSGLRLDGLQIRCTSGKNYQAIYTVRLGGNAWHQSHCARSLVDTVTNHTSLTIRGLDTSNSQSVIYNTVVSRHGSVNTFDTSRGVYSQGFAQQWANVTCVGFDVAFYESSSSSVLLRNGVAQAGTTGYSIAHPHANCSNNLSNKADAPGTSPQQSKTLTFVDAAALDYHLAATDTDAIDKGISDPLSGLFSDDLDSVARTGTWDLGADEYVAAGAPARRRTSVVMW